MVLCDEPEKDLSVFCGGSRQALGESGVTPCGQESRVPSVIGNLDLSMGLRGTPTFIWGAGVLICVILEIIIVFPQLSLHLLIFSQILFYLLIPNGFVSKVQLFNIKSLNSYVFALCQPSF